MIANIDPAKVMFLSVALNDGSIEAFEDIKDAVAHASELVEQGGSERGIFVAVPRARVHMGVRVDPLEPPAMPVPVPASNPSEPSEKGEDWVKAQGLGGHNRLSEAQQPDGPNTGDNSRTQQSNPWSTAA